MENKLTKVIAALAVAGLMAAGPVAYAAPEGDGAGPGKSYKRGEGKGFMKELNLTPEQKAQLEAQREAKKEANKALREQMKTKMQALHEAITKPETKRADVEALVSEVNTLKGQMFSQMIDGVFAMKEVLTPEQFAKMQAKHQAWMNKGPKGWGKHERTGPEGDQPEPPQD